MTLTSRWSPGPWSLVTQTGSQNRPRGVHVLGLDVLAGASQVDDRANLGRSATGFPASVHGRPWPSITSRIVPEFIELSSGLLVKLIAEKREVGVRGHVQNDSNQVR